MTSPVTTSIQFDSWIYYKNRTWCAIKNERIFFKKKAKLQKNYRIKFLIYLRNSVMISVYGVWNTTSYIYIIYYIRWPFSRQIYTVRHSLKFWNNLAVIPCGIFRMNDCWFEKNVSTTNARCVLDQHKTTTENASVYQHTKLTSPLLYPRLSTRTDDPNPSIYYGLPCIKKKKNTHTHK